MKLNIGCGKRYMDGFVNIDFSDAVQKDLKCNLLEGLPYDDNSIEFISATEILEHFNRWNGLTVLKELHRVLQHNGTLFITVPPALEQMKRFIHFYETQLDQTSIAEFNDQGFSIWKWHDDIAGGTEPSNGMDGDSHKTFYTPKTLTCVLDHVGFNIQQIEPNIISVLSSKK